jgi:hypothetical protein
MKTKPVKFPKNHPQSINDPKRQVTLQFMTVAEKNEFIRWYSRSGSNHFWCVLASYGPKWYKTKIGLKWRKVAEERIDKWPLNNERWVP